MANGDPVVLFAEATTGDGNRLLRFRSSHFEAVRQAAASARGADAVVQPVFLDYSRIAGLPVGRRERPLVAWYGDMTFFSHFRRFLAAGGIGCDVYFGAPIRVSPGNRPQDDRPIDGNEGARPRRARPRGRSRLFLAEPGSS